MTPKFDPRLAIVVAVFSISFASIFIKWSESDALTIAAYRMGFATLILLIPTFLLNRQELFGLSRRELVVLALVGVALAFHFGFWISSLKHTTVANSVLLVSTHPILVAVISHYYVRERITPVAGVGVGIALIGMIVIASSDLALSPEFLLGDILALLGMFALATYLLSGRKLRQKTSVLPYVTVVYGTAAVCLFIACFMFGAELIPDEGREWILFLALAIVPTIFGHTVYNWTLKYVTTLVVSMSILFEPILATIFATFMLAPPEIPSIWVLVGGILVLVGIYLVASRSRD